MTAEDRFATVYATAVAPQLAPLERVRQRTVWVLLGLGIGALIAISLTILAIYARLGRVPFPGGWYVPAGTCLSALVAVLIFRKVSKDYCCRARTVLANATASTLDPSLRYDDGAGVEAQWSTNVAYYGKATTSTSAISG